MTMFRIRGNSGKAFFLTAGVHHLFICGPAAKISLDKVDRMLLISVFKWHAISRIVELLHDMGMLKVLVFSFESQQHLELCNHALISGSSSGFGGW